jgi:hypothetical protein
MNMGWTRNATECNCGIMRVSLFCFVASLGVLYACSGDDDTGTGTGSSSSSSGGSSSSSGAGSSSSSSSGGTSTSSSSSSSSSSGGSGACNTTPLGACTHPSSKDCIELYNVAYEPAIKGQCSSKGGTYTAGGTCPKENLVGACIPKSPAFSNHFYAPNDAEKLKMACEQNPQNSWCAP